ncbi:MAG: hypothetical protein WCJ64_00865 [Rhodospirillaceae bacterium]
MTMLDITLESLEFTVRAPNLAIVTVAIDDGDGMWMLIRCEIRRERAMASVNLPADIELPAELETAVARFALRAYNSELALRKQEAAIIPFPRVVA